VVKIIHPLLYPWVERLLYPLNRRERGPHSPCGCDVEEVKSFPRNELNHDFSDFQSVLYSFNPAFKYAKLSCISYVCSCLDFFKSANMFYGYPFECWTNNMSDEKEDGG